MGPRENASQIEFSVILSEGTTILLKKTALISEGTNISYEEHVNIKRLCTMVTTMWNSRSRLKTTLKKRMNFYAPNLTFLVGERIGSRMLAQFGSTIHLAKQPASTIQIIGAEKLCFFSCIET